MKKNTKKTSIWITTGVVALSALILGNIALDNQNEVETSTRSEKETNEHEQNVNKETPKKEKEATAEEKQDEKTKEEVAKQLDSQKVIIDADAPFADRVQQGFYVVQPGDTLSAISNATGVSVEELREVNGIHNADQIAVGWKLAVTQQSIDDVVKEGSFPNLSKQEGAKEEGRYDYSAPTKTPGSTATQAPSAPAEKAPVKTPAKPSVSKPVVKPTVSKPAAKPETGNGQKPEKPNVPVEDEDIKDDVVVDETPSTETGKDEVVTPPANGGSNNEIENTPSTDGDTTEDTTVSGSEEIPGDVDVPAEGPVTDETPGDSSTEDGSESSDVIPPVIDEEGNVETPEIVTVTKNYTVTTILNPGVEHRNDSELAIGETRTVEGTAGSIVESFTQVIRDGVVISDTKTNSVHNPSTPTIIYSGTKAPVINRVTKTKTLETVLLPGRIVRENSELAKGETKVIQEGVAGKRVEIFTQIFENDVFISESLTDTQITDAIPEIVEVGTKESAPTIVKRTDIVKQNIRIAAPADPIIEYSDELAEGVREVKQTAKDGVKEITTEVYYENDVETGRTVTGEVVISEARQAIIVVGTKKEAEKPVVDVRVVTEDVETKAPETIIEYSDKLLEGQETIKQKAKKGLSQVIYEVTYENNVEVSRVKIGESILNAGQAQIIVRGTGKEDVTEYKTIKESIAIDAPTNVIVEYSDELALGEEIVKREAAPGVKEVSVKIKYVNGKEVSRDVVSEVIVKEAVAKIIVKGTKEAVITTDIQTERVEIKQPVTIERLTNELEVGKTRTIQEGSVGIKEITTTTTYVDGVATSVDTVETIITQAKATIIEVGTKDVITTSEEVKDVVIKQPATIRRETAELEKGKERTIQTGKAGSKRVTTTITYTNGVETGRDVQEVIVSQPTATIIEVGTGSVTSVKSEKATINTVLAPSITYNPYLGKDDKVIKRAGQDRIVEYTYDVTYKDGVEVDRVITGQIVIQEGYPSMEEHGTRNQITVSGIPTSGESKESIYAKAEDPENINYEYREVMIGGELAKGQFIEELKDGDIESFNNGVNLDEVLLNQYLLDLINADRAAIGVDALVLDKTLAQGTDVRAKELADHGNLTPIDPATGKEAVDEFGNRLTHVRPANEKGEFEGFHTAFDYRNDEPEYYIGENLAGRTYTGNPFELNSEKHLAELFFQQWKDSPGHYANMMNEMYTDTWVSIKVGKDVNFDADDIYANAYSAIIAAQTFAVDSPTL